MTHTIISTGFDNALGRIVSRDADGSLIERMEIIAQGGIRFTARLGGEFLGSMEFGSIDDDGQYEQDDDDVIEAARVEFSIADDVVAIVR